VGSIIAASPRYWHPTHLHPTAAPLLAPITRRCIVESTRRALPHLHQAPTRCTTGLDAKLSDATRMGNSTDCRIAIVIGTSKHQHMLQSGACCSNPLEHERQRRKRGGRRASCPSRARRWGRPCLPAAPSRSPEPQLGARVARSRVGTSNPFALHEARGELARVCLS
jgi:hypothetical protein